MQPILQFLSPEDIKQIHQSALTILAEVGMRLPAPEALEKLQQAGALVTDQELVTFPADLVTKALEQVPKRQKVVLYAQDPKWDVSFTTRQPALSCMTMATSVLDPFTDEHRSATDQDLAQLVRLADQCEHISVNGGLITPQEVPGDFNDWYTWATCLKNTKKHVTGGMYGEQCVRDAVDMATLACGGREEFDQRPCISGWVLTLPPLAIDRESLAAMLEMGKLNIPSIISSGPILGTTSPVTIAGTCAQAHAEILACITTAQVVNPGAPVVYTSFARGMDMKTGNVHMASPEFAILKGCMAQIGHWLDLPVRMPGMLRDSKCIDAQAGFETGMVGAITALNADIIDAMQLDSDLLVDFADVVFCNECMGALKRLNQPVEVTEKSTALEVIKEVGPGGLYLTHDHTFEFFQQELWMPRIMEHRSYESWENDGGLDIRAVARKKMQEMLEAQSEPLLSPEVQAEIDAIVTRAVEGKR
ncbi:MAG: trimethylamine methyltransferase family protein [Desulfovermiculus sp.]|nr:trimethylamine methyltransferase family protein [Desulfovermiculus sp.]